MKHFLLNLVAFFSIFLGTIGVGVCEESQYLLDKVARVAICEDGRSTHTISNIISVFHNRNGGQARSVRQLYNVAAERGQFSCFKMNTQVPSDKLAYVKKLVLDSLQPEVSGWKKTLTTATNFHNYTVNPPWSKRFRLVAADSGHKYYVNPQYFARNNSKGAQPATLATSTASEGLSGGNYSRSDVLVNNVLT